MATESRRQLTDEVVATTFVYGFYIVTANERTVCMVLDKQLVTPILRAVSAYFKEQNNENG